MSPGDQAEISFDLGKPVGIEQGMRFAIREGGKTVGAGLVTEVLRLKACRRPGSPKGAGVASSERRLPAGMRFSRLEAGGP